MAALPPTADPAVLMDELVEECLLRVPPEEPGDLAGAALVSKQWHRVVTGAVFRSRYIDNLDGAIRFVSTYLRRKKAPVATYLTGRQQHAPGTVSIDKGAGASVVASTDDESGAGVAVSRNERLRDVAVSMDEGPGDAVGSTDEGPGPSMSSA